MIFKTLKRIFAMAETTSALFAGFAPEPQPQKQWRAFCLLEKAFKRGHHVNVKSHIFDILAPDEQSLLKFLTDPPEKGGKGVYKVIFYCSAESSRELQAFNSSRVKFMEQFHPRRIGDIEI